jgi:hypothetical protein
MNKESDIELALLALDVAGNEPAALRMLRDECGIPLSQGLPRLRAAQAFRQRCQQPHSKDV